MKDGPIYKFYVWPINGVMEFFTEEQEEEGREYAEKHNTYLKLV
jgi:hypothetical protein